MTNNLPQPGPELDRIFAERVEHWKTFEGEPGYGLPPGKLSLVLDLIPPYSTDYNVALAALERFCATRGIWYALQLNPPAYPPRRRYSVVLHGDMMPIYGQSAATLAHTVVLAMLDAVATGRM